MAMNPIPKPHSIASLVLGAIEIFLALIVVIISFVLAGKAGLPGLLTPYWCAIPYLIPGILGVVVFFTKNKCAMIAFMVLNIICLVICGIATILIGLVLGVYAAFASHIADRCRTPYGTNDCICTQENGQKTTLKNTNCEDLGSISDMMYTVVVFLIFALLVSFAASILGCIGSCCTNNNQTQTTVVIQQGGGPVAVHTGDPNGQPSQGPPPNYYDAKQ